MVEQKVIKLTPKARGFHVITDEVLRHVSDLPDQGLFHLFIQHTSAGICINESADLDVLTDFETIFNRLVPENQQGLVHTIEGPDDMPAHIKTALVGFDLTIPIRNGKLALGTWQGLYLCEFRNAARARTLVATILS